MHLDSGRLVAVNVQVAHAACLDDPRYVERFFHRLIERIDMKPLTAPMSIVIPPDERNVGDAHADDGGMTTQCIISTSHIAYHSWPLQCRFRLVVDSCKDFSSQTVVSTVAEWFPVNGLSLQDCRYERPEVWRAEEAEEAKEAEADEVTLVTHPPS
jgi:hypothetical protein